MTIAALVAFIMASHVGTAAFVGVMGANAYALYHYFSKSKTTPPKS